MYDIRQFKPALYLVLLLGISGFALAAQSPAIFVLAVCGILLNAWLVGVGRFRPISRLLANLVTLTAVVYVAHELLTSSMMTPVIVIGEFLVFLQLVKLWEWRTNRDFAQLLVLSLLLMVAASLNTASLWFGLIMVAYLFLSLYCCLLFHLKVETDAAKAAMPVPEEKLSPGALRQDQRHLSQSMRRLTALVSVVAIAFGVLVFLFVPRIGAGILGPLHPARGASALTGFSEQVKFQDVARISQSHQTVAYVKVWHNGRLVPGTRTLLLRGLTLDTYRPPAQTGGAWEWTRSIRPSAADVAAPDDPWSLPTTGKDLWRQQVALWPTHTDVLFAMPGAVRFAPRRGELKIRYSADDGALQTFSSLYERIDYDVVSTGQPGPGDVSSGDEVPAAIIRQEFPRIFQFARRPEVCGSDEHGSLGDQRIAQGDVSPLDAKIAANIQAYLRTHFTYTLDLTDEKRFDGRDPLDAFLYDWKRGHCEYFAGAMTLMCQSLGMRSRMAIGFKCAPDDYNSFSDLYAVHDSDAHAWVEVKTPQGWKTFDPTSSIDAAPRRGSELLARARHFLEYLEYTYANAVITYDNQDRASIIAGMETGMAAVASRGSTALQRFQDSIVGNPLFLNASMLVLSGFLFLMLAVVAGACGWFFLERWLLRRRARRIGIESLPQAEQLRLARQLGFYDDLLRLLDRHRITRPAHFTPMEFSRSLTFLPTDAFDTVQRLTALFYRVRYGGTELPATRQRRLANVLSRLNQELAGSNSGTGYQSVPKLA